MRLLNEQALLLVAVVCAVILNGFGCSRPVRMEHLGDSGSSPSGSPPAVASAARARMLTEAEALALVEALPEFRAIANSDIDEGRHHRKGVPVARVTKAPTLASAFEASGVNEGNYWSIQVADRAYFADERGTKTGEPPDIDLRVDAFTGALAIFCTDRNAYRDYASWSTLQRNVMRATALAMSVPEWEAEAAVVRQSPAGRTKNAVLGLVMGPEPPADCKPGTPECRYGFTALSVCTPCAGGRWVDVEIDPSNETLFVNDNDLFDTVPYGKWRDHFRSKVRKQSPWEYVTLLAANRAFPVLKSGDGPFGYGTPRSVSRPKPAAALLAAIEQGGYSILRTERYAGGFPLYVVQVKSGEAPPPDLRVWGKSLVTASGARSCEVATEAGDRRYQFDPTVLKGNAGGVYVFVNGDFHPWLARD